MSSQGTCCHLVEYENVTLMGSFKKISMRCATTGHKKRITQLSFLTIKSTLNRKSMKKCALQSTAEKKVL